MMLVITACAGGLAVWRVFIYEPPTHKIALYEKAPGTRRGWIDVGPNRIRLRLIARNDRDGSIHYDDQRSTSAKLLTQREKDLASPAAWLDVVQIELDPGHDQVDVIEVRIFDHETRELLPQLHRAYGWQTIAPNIVQIYGLGKSLPDKLDIWFRAHSYAAGDPIVKLATSPGSTCDLPGGTLTLHDIRAGFHPFNGHDLHGKAEREEVSVATVINWAGKWEADRYQIAAVSADGAKRHTDVPHFLNFTGNTGVRQPIYFEAPLSELDHFELRRFGGRERFFFEAVELPKTSTQPFTKPPSARVKIAGKETEADLTEFDPLHLRIAARRGEWATGTAASGLWAAVTPADEVTNQDKAFTFTYHGVGVGNLALKVRFLDAETEKVVEESDLPRGATGAGSGSAVSAGYIEYWMPLDRIDSVDVTLGP